MKTYLIAVAKNESKYIDDWIAWHRKLGFTNIIIYDNSGNGNLKSYENIEVYDAPGESIQLQAYADALNKLTYGTWAITLDIDEYLDLGGITVDEFLKPYNGVDSVKLNWVCYGDCEQTKFEDRPVTERFIKPSRLDCVYNDTIKIPENLHTKSFFCYKYKPTQIDIHCTHIVGGIAINTDGKQVNMDAPFTNELCLKRGFVRHYITKSVTEWCERRLNTKDACGNVVADFDTLKRWYFNINTYSKEKEDIIESYRPNKDLGTVPSVCNRELLQPLAESERPESNSKQINRSHKRVRGGK